MVLYASLDWKTALGVRTALCSTALTCSKQKVLVNHNFYYMREHIAQQIAVAPSFEHSTSFDSVREVAQHAMSDRSSQVVRTCVLALAPEHSEKFRDKAGDRKSVV